MARCIAKLGERRCDSRIFMILGLPGIIDYMNQCCGSGSALIWLSLIRIRSMEIDQNKQTTLFYCLSKRLLYLHMYIFDLLPITLVGYIFHGKIQLFVSLARNGSVQIFIGLAPWIRSESALT
jgi:hypothetical protein